ncbi:MAG: hypothetical protein J5546_06570 [Lachnospiraceae bacterium]|nr:hypothetical protein [Lachnospiraceae bacterium]
MEDFWNLSTKNKDKVRYRQSRSYSPYSEFFSDWRTQKDGLTYLSINAFYRFDEIMEPLFHASSITDAQREWLFDVFMHYLIELEFRSGTTKADVDVHLMMDEIKNGRYRNDMAEIFRELSNKEQYYIAHMAVKQEETGASVLKFAEALSVMLENAIVYKNKHQEKTLLLYVGKRQNAADQRKIDLITELFAPLGYNLTVFWEKHFAVLEEKQTMEIDEIELL